jgi:hypothetical protein
MTPDRFRACLVALAWSQRHLAPIVGYDERQVRRWAAGATIPADVAAWLETLAQCHEANPPPVGRPEATLPPASKPPPASA